MPLAKSQWHQPFPGFFRSEIHEWFHRCQPLFPPDWWDSNPFFSAIGIFGTMWRPFWNSNFQKGRYFSTNRIHKVWGVDLLVVMGQWVAALFRFQIASLKSKVRKLGYYTNVITELTRHLIWQAACKHFAYDPLHYGVLSSDDLPSL